MTRTSSSHPLLIAEAAASDGVIGLTFCPGKKDKAALTGAWDRDLAVDLKVIADWGAVAVVTLLEDHELTLLKVPELGAMVKAKHMGWFHLPIKDVSIPDQGFEARWGEAGEALRGLLRCGGRVLLHCRGGLGRTGLLAARLMVELGSPPQRAIQAVREARPGAIETAAQEQHVLGCKPQVERQPALSPSSLRDRARGALLGLAVGDAVGTTVEFKARDDDAPLLTDMVGGGPFKLRAGQWTDDTAMAAALSDSLIAHDGLDCRDLLDRFVQWWQHGTYSCTGTCFDIGSTTRRALAAYLASGDVQGGPSGTHDAGNGSLMRLAPVAIRFWNDPEARRDAAERQSCTTHGAAEAVAACTLFADMLADAIAGKPRSAVLRNRTGDWPAAIANIASGGWRGKHRSRIKGSGYVVDALEAAIWCFATTTTFDEAVLRAANLRDDADTTAAITGQLAGAFYGAEAIPTSWLKRLEWRARLQTMADALLQAAGKAHGSCTSLPK